MKSPSHILTLHCKEKIFPDKKDRSRRPDAPISKWQILRVRRTMPNQGCPYTKFPSKFQEYFSENQRYDSIVGIFDRALKKVQPYFIFVHSIRALHMIQLTILMEPLKHLPLIRHRIMIKTFILAPQTGTSSAPPTMSS